MTAHPKTTKVGDWLDDFADWFLAALFIVLMIVLAVTAGVLGLLAILNAAGRW